VMASPHLVGLVAVSEMVLLASVARILVVISGLVVGRRWELVRVLGVVLDGCWGGEEEDWGRLW